MTAAIQDSPEGGKFEQDLKAYFPDIYELFLYGKQEPRVWEVVYAMLEMKRETCYGDITVTYQGGKIQHAFKRQNVIVEPGKRLTTRQE